MEHISVQQGQSQLLVSVPHAGTVIPTDIRDRLQPESLFLPDTDWFVDRLYAWAPVLRAGLIATRWSRYVVDVNRPPDDAPLYDRPTTSVVPDTTFYGKPLYREGCEPTADEIADRVDKYWKPFHARLGEELAAIREKHGAAVLLDAHSIRSELPMLFEGRLPSLNLGSNSGASAARGLIDAAWQLLDDSDFSSVRDGRFKGGHITRHYGRPQDHVHAIQLEIAQRAYMPEFPPQWDRARAAPLITLLKQLVRTLRDWRPAA